MSEQVLESIYAENVRLRAELIETQSKLANLLNAMVGEAPPYYRVATLTRTEARIVSIIAAAGVVRSEALFDALWPNATRREASNVVAVHIGRIRKKLEPHGIRVGSIHGIGYEITPENVEKLRGIAA